MKKIVKSSLALLALCSLSAMNVNAKNVSANDIKDLSAYEEEVGQKNYEVFVYGKHVHIGVITFADLMTGFDSAVEIKDSNLYYKTGDNKWQKTSTTEKWEDITDVSDLNFEMVKLIGTKTGDDCIATNECKDGVDSSYVTTENYLGGRFAEVFLDESQDLNVVSIKPVNVGTDIGTNSIRHNYNTQALNSVTFDVDKETLNGTLKLAAKSPLLSYDNGNEESAQKWFALLVKTNKTLTKEDLEHIHITIGSHDYTIEPDDLAGAQLFGGDSKTFVMWLNTSRFEGNKAILTIKVDEKETQKINMEFTEPQTIYEYSVNGKVDQSTITVGEKNVNVETVDNGDGTYLNIFYVANTDDKTAVESTAKIDFTVNNDKRRLVKTDSWIAHELIELSNVNAVEPVDEEETDSNWNQAAITDSKIEKTTYSEENPYDYLVTISADHVLKGDNKVKLGLDLGINTTGIGVVGGSYAKDSEVNTKGILELALSENGTTVTFTNPKYNDDKVVVKFVIAYDEEIKLTFKAEKAKADIDLYPNTDVQAEGTANANYRKNMSFVEPFEAVLGEDGKYNVTVQTNGALVTFVRTGRTTSAKKYIGVIVDLGVDPTKLNIKVGGTEYTVNEEDITDASRLGATTETAFIMWLNPTTLSENQEVIYTYEPTNASVDVVFAIKEITLLTDANKDKLFTESTEVKIDEKYQDSVSYVGEHKFSVNRDVTDGYIFVANIDGHDYTYKVTWTNSANHTTGTIARVKNLELKAAYKNIMTDATVDQYTIDSIESVSIDPKKPNTVHVIFNRPISTEKQYALVFDLGDDIGTDTIAGSAKSSAPQQRLTAEDYELYSADGNTDTTSVNWLKESLTNENAEKEFTISITRTNSTSSITTTPLVITVISTVNDTHKDNFELKQEETKSLDESKLEEYFTGTKSAEERNNNEAISTEVNEKGEIVITYDKALQQFVPEGTQQEQRSYFGVVVDLGIDPRYLQGKSAGDSNYHYHYEFQQNDKTGDTIVCTGESVNNTDERCESTRAKYNLTETQFIIWLDAETFEEITDEAGNKRKEYKTTFVSTGNKDNQFAEVTLTFVLVDGREPLKLTKNPEALNANAAPSSVVGSDVSYKNNQSLFKAVYTEAESEAQNPTLTISPVSTESEAAVYPITIGEEQFTGNWYAVTLDFGKKVSIPEYSNVKLEYVADSTAVILWINRSAHGQIVFTDEYDKEQTFKITIVNSQEVSSNTAA